MADRFAPRRIVLAALLLTAVCNAVLPFAVSSVASLVALQALNGFAQAMFWPPLVKIFATSLPQGRYNGAVFAVNAAANVAIVAIFALVAWCVRFMDWRVSFWLVAGIALMMAVAWWRQCAAGFGSQVQKFANSDSRIPSANPETRTPNPDSALSFPIAFAALVPIALAIVCIGVMRDGIEAWAPSIVSDLYGLSASGSTASVALLPVFAVVSMAGARALRRALGDEVRAALTLFAIGLGCAAVLLASGGATIWAGLPLLALLSATMHGANLMLIGELPGRFASTGRVGTISGALNACVYVGAAISIYGFAALREHFAGWRPVFGLWAALLLLAVALCAVALRRRGAGEDV
jgi:OPA family glycerol-3-phosphate transporter-like MFS transporter